MAELRLPAWEDLSDNVPGIIVSIEDQGQCATSPFMTKNLEDLKLRPSLPAELNQLGYETAEDMSQINSVELLRTPGMGGHDWRKIAKAIGREPFSKKVRR